MLGLQSFRFRAFRSQERDAQTDLQRSEMVLNAVEKALTNLDNEISGLQRRVEHVRDWVGGLIDSDTHSSTERSTSAEADLIGAEHQLINGVKRLDELTAIRMTYSSLRNVIVDERDRALEAARVRE